MLHTTLEINTKKLEYNFYLKSNLTLMYTYRETGNFRKISLYFTIDLLVINAFYVSFLLKFLLKEMHMTVHRSRKIQ